jgi:Uma2 family endonuclease
MPAAKPTVRFEDMGELLRRLGNISPKRVCTDPLPGLATESDLLRKHGRPHKLYELVEGTLVEKAIGHAESIVAAKLIVRLGGFIELHQLGYFSGSDDLIRLMPKVVRGPDVSFTSWTQRPEGTADTDAISDVIPSLVVEVLSKGKTRGEIAKKLKDYFFAGVQLAWVIDPKMRTAEAYTATDAKTAIPVDGELDGADVVPGFTLPLADLFESLPAPIAKKPKGKKKK